MPTGTHGFYSVFTIAGYLCLILHGIIKLIRVIGHNAIGAQIHQVGHVLRVVHGPILHGHIMGVGIIDYRGCAQVEAQVLYGAQ